MKKYSNILIFILIHICIAISVFYAGYLLNNRSDFLIKSLDNKYDNIIQISIMLITIIISFEFVIKQIYSNRASSKYISFEIKSKGMYQLTYLGISCIVTLLFDNNPKFITPYFLSYIASIIYFIYELHKEIDNTELNRVINKKIDQIIETLKSDFSNDVELRNLNNIYLDCITKNEINLASQIIVNYKKFLSEQLNNKNRNILTNESNIEEFKDNQGRLLNFFKFALIQDQSINSIKINKKILSILISYLEDCYKCNEDALSKEVEIFIRGMFLYDLTGEITDLYHHFLVSYLDSAFEETNEYDKSFRKTQVIFSITKMLIQKGKIYDCNLLIEYILIKIDNSNIAKIPDNIKDEYVEIFEFYLVETNSDYKFACLKQFDSKLEDDKFYHKLIAMYENITSYKNIYQNSEIVNDWLDYFSYLIKKDNKEYIFRIYELYFSVILSSIGIVEIMPSKTIPQINYFEEEKIFDGIIRIIKKCMNNQKKYYLKFIFDQLNMLVSAYSMQEKAKQEKIVGVYDLAFWFLSTINDETIFDVIISSFLELCEKLDKERKISKDLGKTIVSLISDAYKKCTNNRNSLSNKLFMLYDKLFEESADYHFIKEHIAYIYDDIFDIAIMAIEYNDDITVKASSNFFGWQTKRYIDNNKEKASEVYEYGFRLFSALISVNYTQNVIIFVGTFIVTIASYCFSPKENSKFTINKTFGDKIVSKLDSEMLEFIKKSFSLRKCISKSWDGILSCNFSQGIIQFEDKINSKIKVLECKKK